MQTFEGQDCEPKWKRTQLPVSFSQDITIFPPPWIIKNGLLSPKPCHFWVACLTPLMELIPWLCTACFCETRSIRHFTEIPWGEKWIPSLLSAFWFCHHSWLLFSLFKPSTAWQKMDWRESPVAWVELPPPSCDLPPRKEPLIKTPALDWNVGTRQRTHLS